MEEDEPAEQPGTEADFVPLSAGDEQPKETPHTDGVKASTKHSKDAPATKKRRKTKSQDPTPATTEPDAAEATTDQKQDPKKSRFIAFIGNLPYATTDDTLRAHFAKLAPFNLRHRTDPKTKKSKGFAFLEFEKFDRLKTCLKLYHHTMFDPATALIDGDGSEGKGGQSKGARRINVELTAGGGGKTDARKEKIKVKNERLDEQRKRRIEYEGKEKERADKKAKKSAPASESKGPASAEVDVETDADIHPSRRKMISA